MRIRTPDKDADPVTGWRLIIRTVAAEQGRAEPDPRLILAFASSIGLPECPARVQTVLSFDPETLTASLSLLARKLLDGGFISLGSP
jgi:hypothetical protein